MNEIRNGGRAERYGRHGAARMGRANVTIERRHALPTLHQCYAPLRTGASVERHIFCGGTQEQQQAGTSRRVPRFCYRKREP